MKLDFVGANPNVKLTGGEQARAVISYFKGSKEQWKTGLETYGSIVYSDLWPGIDLVYSGTANRLKYTFLVKPGADPDQIRLAYRGATAVRANASGELEVETPTGGFRDDQPYAYQEIAGRRSEVRAAYDVETGAAAGGPRGYKFELGDYDRTRPLVLDPAVLVYAGFIGGSDSEFGGSIAVDASGSAYVAGSTLSNEASFPETVGPDLTHNSAGNHDAFVAKVNSSGTALVYAGYIGGNGGDTGNGIAVDASGNAYVAGTAGSTQTTFPVTVGPDLTHNGTGIDAFVAKVNPSGTALVYCGYIGGNNNDFGNGIAVDAFANAYVTGRTASTEATFPETVGPDLTFGGGEDAFVAKVNASGLSLAYAGYIGGTGLESGNGVAVDGLGNAYVSGFTASTEATFPETVGPDLSFNGGSSRRLRRQGRCRRRVRVRGLPGGHRRRFWQWRRCRRSRQRLRRRGNVIDRGHVPGDRRPRPHLQRRRPRRLRGEGQCLRPGARLRRLHRRQRRRLRPRHRARRYGQCLRGRGDLIEPDYVPGDRRSGPDLQRRV